MSYCINVEDVQGEEIAPGVIKRVLLTPENTGRGPPGELKVNHYTLSKGGILVLDDPGVEYQDYIISGSVLYGIKYIHGNTTVFTPSGKKHSYRHAGESEARIISTTYSVPHPSHRWCKSRLAILTEEFEQQLMTEEFHGLTGAHRFHALDIQTWDRKEHTNPEETAYFLRGTGKMRVHDNWFDVKPGTLCYSEEGALHAVKNTNQEGLPLQYYVMEYTEQDKMWSQRGYKPNFTY
jgi:mannose-6-phosphate isomerase-like protein (cupin superfamily)